MKKSKKVLALALAAIMAVSAFAGCGGSTDETTTPVQQQSSSNNENTTTAEPPTSLKILLPHGDHAYDEDAQTIEFRKRIEEYTNTDIEWELYDANAYAEKLTLRYATGDLASIIVVMNNDDAAFLNACKYNVFWEISDYLDLFPNLAAIPMTTRLAASLNGNLYGVPRARGNIGRMSLTYRGDWAANLNLKAPTTIEDLYDMAVAFTNDDPDKDGQNDTYAFGWDGWSGAIYHMACWFGAPNTWGLKADGTLEYVFTTEEFKNALKNFRQWYSEGLVPQDFFSVKAGKARATYMNTSICGIYVQCLDDARKIQTHLNGTETAPGTEPNAIITFTNAPDAGYGIRVMPQNNGFAGYLAIPRSYVPTEQDLMKVLQFLDDMSDAEMSNLVDSGIEGQDYELDENGYVSAYDTDKRTELGLGSAQYRNGYNQLLPYFHSSEEAAKRIGVARTSDVETREAAQYADNLNYLVTNPANGLVSATFSEIGTDLNKIVEDAMFNYIQGLIDDTALNAAIEQWKEAGGNTVVEEMNALYAAANN